MTECIKTGAHIYIEQYGEWVYTDLFVTGDCYHFWVESSRHRSRTPLTSVQHLTVHETGMSLRNGREMVVPIANCNQFCYHGEPVAMEADNG